MLNTDTYTDTGGVKILFLLFIRSPTLQVEFGCDNSSTGTIPTYPTLPNYPTLLPNTVSVSVLSIVQYNVYKCNNNIYNIINVTQ